MSEESFSNSDRRDPHEIKLGAGARLLLEKAIIRHCYGADYEAAGLLVGAEALGAPPKIIALFKGLFFAANQDHKDALIQFETCGEIPLPPSLQAYRRRREAQCRALAVLDNTESQLSTSQ